MNPNQTCCFTGHRSRDLPFGHNEESTDCLNLIYLLENSILSLYEENKVRTFISGMALGADQIAAEAVLRLRKSFPDMSLIAAVPCLGQENLWNDREKKRYYDILSNANHVYTLKESYTKSCMIERNKFMVDKSEHVIAIWSGKKSGGTYQTVKYARSENKSLIIIDPFTLTVKNELKQENLFD